MANSVSDCAMDAKMYTQSAWASSSSSSSLTRKIVGRLAWSLAVLVCLLLARSLYTLAARSK